MSIARLKGNLKRLWRRCCAPWDGFTKRNWWHLEDKEEPLNLVQPIVTLLNAWVVATFAFGVALLGTSVERVATDVQGQTQRIELSREPPINLYVKIGVYVATSLVICAVLFRIPRMHAVLNAEKKAPQLIMPESSSSNVTRKPPRTSRTDRLTDDLSRLALMSILVLTFGGAALAGWYLYPGQAQVRADEYRFQIDGSAGFRILEPVTFESDAHDLELIATIHPAINKDWELVGVMGYIGGRQSVDKPDLQMVPIPGLQDDAPQYAKKRRYVFLHDIKKHAQYTLAFRFHIRPGSKTAAKDALKFLTDYPSAFAVTIDEPDSTQP